MGLLLVGALAIAVAMSLPWRPGVVVGASMVPTLAPGTVFAYDREYYRTHPVRAGKIVVARHNGEILIKRVFAVSGDRFWARREWIGENLVHLPISPGLLPRNQRLIETLKKMGRTDAWLVRLRVPHNYLFLMGDGSESLDSRHFGYVEADNILGRVVTLDAS